MTDTSSTSINLPRLEAEKLFYSCWNVLVKRLGKTLPDIAHNTEMNEVDADAIRYEISDLLRETLKSHNPDYEIFISVYECIFFNLILPSSHKHHELSLAMIAPYLMNFEALDSFIDSWIADNYSFLLFSMSIENELRSAVANFDMGLGLGFDQTILEAMVQDKVKLVEKLKSSEFTGCHTRFYKAPTERLPLREFLENQLMSEVCEELAHKLMKDDSLDTEKLKNQNPIFIEYQHLFAMGSDYGDIVNMPNFYKAYLNVLLEKPSLCLKFITIRIKGKKAAYEDLPFGLMGLMIFRAFESTIVLLFPELEKGCGYCLSEFQPSKNNIVLKTAMTHAAFNLRLAKRLSYLEDEQIVRHVIKQQLLGVSYLYQQTTMKFDDVLKEYELNKWFVANEGFSNTTLEKVRSQALVFTAAQGEFYS